MSKTSNRTFAAVGWIAVAIQGIVTTAVAAGPPPPNAGTLEQRLQDAQTYASTTGAVRLIVLTKHTATPSGQALLSASASAVASITRFVSSSDIVAAAPIAGQLVSLTAKSGAIDTLRNNPAVEDVFIDQLSAPTLQRSVPAIEADSLQSAGNTGSGFAVAIVDSGVDSTHPAFAGRITDEACFSFTDTSQDSTSLCPSGNDSEIGPGAGAPCNLALAGCEHGTHVAGIAASAKGSLNGKTIVGVAPGASIIPIQVFSLLTGSAACGTGVRQCIRAWESSQIAALEYLNNLTPNINIAAVNMSLADVGSSATNCDRDGRKKGIDQLRTAGVLTIVSAGNDGNPNGIAAPACISSAVSVGASQGVNAIAAGLSDRSPDLTILAPGMGVNSTWPMKLGGGYHALDGTSMAAPHVVGVVALLRAAFPAASVSQIQQALVLGTPTLKDPATHASFHVLDARIALANLQHPTSPVAAAPSSSTLLPSSDLPVTSGSEPLRAIVTVPAEVAKPSDALTIEQRRKILSERKISDHQFTVTAPREILESLLQSHIEVELDKLSAPNTADQK